MTDPLAIFWKYAARLKTVERKGWKKLPVDRIESVADHSFAVAMLALFEGERRRYDIETLLTLALIHDLEEAIIGDLTPDDKKRRGILRLRKDRTRAVRTLVRALPSRSRKRYLELWTDLRLLRTREARLVHQLDKLDMALQASTYAKTVGRGAVDKFFQSASKAIADQVLKRILDSIS